MGERRGATVLRGASQTERKKLDLPLTRMTYSAFQKAPPSSFPPPLKSLHWSLTWIPFNTPAMVTSVWSMTATFQKNFFLLKTPHLPWTGKGAYHSNRVYFDHQSFIE
ncbi:unnamed protein product [Caretta caretta]